MKVTNIECHTNPSSGSRVDTEGQTEGNVTKLVDAISDYANAPEEATLDPPTKKKIVPNIEPKVWLQIFSNHLQHVI
jgi:hypothetical protein